MNACTCILACIACILGASVSFVSAAECPAGWAQRLTRCYYFSDKTVNWFSAWSDCNTNRSRLLSIESEAERNKSKGYIQLYTNGRKNWWISGSDYHNTGDWAWYGTKNPILYDNFCSSTDIGNGHCLAIDHNCGLQWSSHICHSDLLRYICEKDAYLG